MSGTPLHSEVLPESWQFVAFTQELFIILLKVRDGRTRVKNFSSLFSDGTRAQVVVRNGIFTCLKFRFCPGPCRIRVCFEHTRTKSRLQIGFRVRASLP